MPVLPKLDDLRSRDHPVRSLPGAIASHVDAAVRGIIGDVRDVLKGDHSVRPATPDSLLQPHLLSPTALSVLNGPPVKRSEIVEIKSHLEKVLADVETSLEVHHSAGFQPYYHKDILKMVEVAEAYASDLKYALDIGVFAEKVSKESATEVKGLVDRLVLAMRDSRFMAMRDSSFRRVNMLIPNLRALREAPMNVGSICNKAFAFAGFVEGLVLLQDIVFPDKNNGPGLFRDIGKQARAILHNEYLTGYDMTLSSVPNDKLFVTTSCKMLNQAVISRVTVQLQHMNLSVDMNALLNSNVVTKLGFDYVASSGLKGNLYLPRPWNNTSKFEIEAYSPFAGLTTSTGLYLRPLVDFSGLWGTKLFSAGFHCELNTDTSVMTRAMVGLSVRKDHSAYGLTLNRGGLLTGTIWKELVPKSFNFPDSMKPFEKYVNPIIKKADSLINYLSPSVITTRVGAMFDYCFSTNRARVMVGVEHELDPATTLKGRVDSVGWATALVKRKIGEKAFVTVSSEVNLNDLGGPPRIGIRLSLP